MWSLELWCVLRLFSEAMRTRAGYVCLKTELVDGESDFHAGMPAAFCLCRVFGLAPRFSKWFALVQRRFSWVVRMISMLRCLLRSPLPR